MEQEQNPFLVDPFKNLAVDTARFDFDRVFKEYQDIINALGTIRSEWNEVHGQLIDMGGKKAGGGKYDSVNKRRYQLDKMLATLSEKKEMIEHVFYGKGKESRSADKGQRWLPQ